MPKYRVEMEIIGTRTIEIEAKSVIHAKAIVDNKEYPSFTQEIEEMHILEIVEVV